MKKNILFAILFALPAVCANAAMPFVGAYQTIDDETKQPKSIVQIYEYQDEDETKIAGRIIALYNAQGEISETINNPVRIADKVKGAPKMAGLDIIWDMEWDDDDSEYSDGKIMDPKSGKIYSSVMWQTEPSVLNVRGKIGPFGRTQNWNTLDKASLPTDIQNIDTTGWKPIR